MKTLYDGCPGVSTWPNSYLNSGHPRAGSPTAKGAAGAGTTVD